LYCNFLGTRLGMKHLKIAVLSLILATAFITIAHSYFGVFSPATGLEASTESSPFRVSIMLDKAHYEPKEDMRIVCKCRNIGNSKVTLYFSQEFLNREDRDCYTAYFDFSIAAQNGSIMYQWSYERGAALHTHQVTLDPSQELKNVFTWDQTVVSSGPWKPIPAGTYLMKARMPPRHDGFSTGHQDSWSLETPTIAFTIG